MERADILVALVVTFRGDPAAIIERCEEALGEAGAEDARAARILALRTGIHLWNADVGASLVDSRAGLEKAERVGDPALLALAIARLATAESLAAVATPGLLERGAEIEEHYGLELQYFESPLYLRSRHLLRLGEIDRSRVILEELQAGSAARGDEGSHAMILWTLGMLEWFAGSWQRALEHATAAHDLTEQTQHSHGRVWVGRVKALVEADLGLVDQARASAEDRLPFRGRRRTSTAPSSARPVRPARAGARQPRGGSGLPALASGAAARRGVERPDGNRVGRRDRDARRRRRAPEARDYLDSTRCTRSASAVHGLSPARPLLGLLAAAEGDLTVSFEAFERALGTLEGLQYPLERGRTLLCLGTVRRQAQQKKAAREALEQALAIFEELGARLWAEKARAELKRISGRPPASEELTETERRRRASPPGTIQQGDRRRAVHGREHRRGPPLARVPQARRPPRTELGPGSPCRGKKPPQT